MKATPPIISLMLPTREGVFVAGYSERGLARLEFPRTNGAPRRAAPDPSRRAGGQRSETGAVAAWHRLTTKAVEQILTGRDAEELPPLDLASGTEFQQAVWRTLMRIRAGETKSYGAVACAIGRPQAVRAVGAACGANPIPLLVPCHRVVASGGKIGGFSCGVKLKLELLAKEGVVLV